MAKEIDFKHARLTAFSSTRRARLRPEEDDNIQALLKTETDTVTVFGKTWDLHATRILNVSLDENLSMIEDTVAYLKGRDRQVIFDAEHFFDGYNHNPQYALKAVQAAEMGGADFIVLCDTNGGNMPDQVSTVMKEVRRQCRTKLGIHTHNDCGLALANSLTAVQAGARMVQGTINGYGERCGNADLISVVGNLHFKLGFQCVPEKSVKQLTELSRFVSEVANIPPQKQRPFVGKERIRS